MRGRAGTASDADLRVPAAPVNAALERARSPSKHALLRVANLPIGSSVLWRSRAKTKPAAS